MSPSSKLSPTLKAPQQPILWDHSASSIESTLSSSIERSQAFLDRIAALPSSECNFSSVFAAIAKEEAELYNSTHPLTFYQYVSTNDALRGAANAAEQRLNEHGIESSMRIDVFKALKAAKENIEKSGQTLEPEEERLVERLLLEGKRNGLDLPEGTRGELVTLKKDLSNTVSEFYKNFNEEKGTITFAREQLEGVPEDVISGYGKKHAEDGTELFIVTFKQPDISPIPQYAHDPETRKKAKQAEDSKLEINVPLVEKVINLRQKLAELLRYDTWADYVEETKMIKTGQAVKDFLQDLQTKLHPIGLKERDALLKLKAEEHVKSGYPVNDDLFTWDYGYYTGIFDKRTLGLDGNLIREYFPVDVVVPAILEIYQELLGVQFREGTGTVWHPEVQHFEVWNAGAVTGEDFLGHMYLDLHTRENKYSHIAVWSLLQGYLKDDGSRQYPEAALVANFAKPNPDRPALMRHHDATMFMHEMGHVFHELLSRTRYGRFHGTTVVMDFAEAPSQMLENWCWEPTILKRISSHYKTKEPLSDDLIDKLLKHRDTSNGLYYLQQIFFGIYDIEVHSNNSKVATGQADYSKLWCDLKEEISLIKSGDVITPGQSSFGHLMGDYSAGYYGYLYSQVFSADMYETVFAKDPMNPVSGARYRKEILLPGSSREEMDSLKHFLGRAPTSDAFLKVILGESRGAGDA